MSEGHRAVKRLPKLRRKDPGAAPVSRKSCLFGGAHQTREAWSDLESSALVEFLLLHRSGDKWTCEKDIAFWEQAARHVKMRANYSFLRSGEA